MRAIEQIKKTVSMAPQEKNVEMPDGSSFSYWVTPMTLAERSRAQKQTKGDDASDYALQLLVSKAKDANGSLLFAPGDLVTMRNELPATVVEQLMLQLLVQDGVEDEDEEALDVKSVDEAA